MIEHVTVDGEPGVRVWCERCGTLVLMPRLLRLRGRYLERCSYCQLEQAGRVTFWSSVGAAVCFVALIVLALASML